MRLYKAEVCDLKFTSVFTTIYSYNYIMKLNNLFLSRLPSFILLVAPLLLAEVVGMEKVEELQLEEAIVLTLENNYEIEIERMNPKVASEFVMVAESAFDMRLEASYTYQSIDTPQNTQDFVATGGSIGGGAPNETSIFEERNQIAKIALIKQFTLGTTAELSTSHSILDNSLNRDSASALFYPEYET